MVLKGLKGRDGTKGLKGRDGTEGVKGKGLKGRDGTEGINDMEECSYKFADRHTYTRSTLFMPHWFSLF